MRIALVVDHFPVISETFVVNIARAVIDAGHTLDIISTHGRPDSPEVHPDVAEYDMLSRHITPDVPLSWPQRVSKAGAALARARKLHGGRAFRTIPPLNWGWRALNFRMLYESAVLRGEPYDVIHCQFAVLAPHMLHHRDIGTINGKLVGHFRGADITRDLKKHGEGYYDRVFREAEGFIANSEHFRQTAIDAGCPGEKIDVVFSGLEIANFPFRQNVASKGDGIRLVNVGRLVEKKGQRYALQTVGELKARGHAVTLDILGEGPLRGALEAEARALGVTENVNFHGASPRGEVVQALSNGHIFLAHSVTAADGDQDGPTNTVKEAMAVGLPVIATRHGGYPEIVRDGETGHIVEEHDATAMTDRVEALCADPAHWQEMTLNARRLMETDCATDVVNPRILSIYERIAAG